MKKSVMEYPEKWPVPYGKTRKQTLECKDGSRAQQEFKDDCDINVIMERYRTNKELPQFMKTGEPLYGDFSNPLDYQSSLNTVAHAREQFESLPARVREEFQNDPQKFLEFAVNGENAEKMVELGLMKPEAVKRVVDAKKKKQEDIIEAEVVKRSGKKEKEKE